MKREIISAAEFLVQLLRLQTGQLSERQLEMFKSSLTEVLRLRYRDHWFPDRPNRGSGYRCIRINGKMDPVIAQAGRQVGLLPTVLHSLFPSELTMWIDPAEVSYRIGENGSICVLYEPQHSSSESEDSNSSSNSSTSSTSSPTISHIQHQQQLSQHHTHYNYLIHHYQQHNNHQQQHHHPHHHQLPLQQQQQHETCKDSLLLEHNQFSEQIAAFVSS